METTYRFSTTIPMVFGQLFTIYRNNLELTQKEFASALGVGVSNISKIELGETVISIEQLFAICLLLKKKPSNLLNTIEIILDVLDKNDVLVINNKILKSSKDINLKLPKINEIPPIFFGSQDKKNALFTISFSANYNYDTSNHPFSADYEFTDNANIFSSHLLSQPFIGARHRFINEDEDKIIILPVISGDKLHKYIIEALDLDK